MNTATPAKQVTRTVNVFDYNDLTDKAKEAAYYAWVDREPYGWHDENRKVLAHINETVGVAVHDWSYSTNDYHYHLADADGSTFYNYNRECDYYQGYAEVTGLKATKLAMDMYYRLTSTSRVYVQHQGKRLWYSGFKPAQWVKGKPTKEVLKWKRSKLEESNTCFTGYIASDVFATALWDSIRGAGVDKHNTLEQFITDAFDELFRNFEDDFAASTSQKYFSEYVAPEYYYLANGQEFGDRDEVDAESNA